jgi:predicted S18 family serine protease
MENKQTALDWLEEFLNSHCNPSVCNVEYSDFKLAIEKAKQMEKEQMLQFAEYVAKYPNKNKNYLGEILHSKSKYDDSERTIDLLNEYFKQQDNGKI